MTKAKNHNILFWIFFVFLCAASLALLELNKNTLAAWGVTLALLIGYARRSAAVDPAACGTAVSAPPGGGKKRRDDRRGGYS